MATSNVDKNLRYIQFYFFNLLDVANKYNKDFTDEEKDQLGNEILENVEKIFKHLTNKTEITYLVALLNMYFTDTSFKQGLQTLIQEKIAPMIDKLAENAIQKENHSYAYYFEKMVEIAHGNNPNNAESQEDKAIMNASVTVELNYALRCMSAKVKTPQDKYELLNLIDQRLSDTPYDKKIKNILSYKINELPLQKNVAVEDKNEKLHSQYLSFFEDLKTRFRKVRESCDGIFKHSFRDDDLEILIGQIKKIRNDFYNMDFRKFGLTETEKRELTNFIDAVEDLYKKMLNMQDDLEELNHHHYGR